MISKNLVNKELDNGKFSEMCCRDFCNIFFKNPNVKSGKIHKPGGGGLAGVESG
jgi:hypothetical protein